LDLSSRKSRVARLSGIYIPWPGGWTVGHNKWRHDVWAPDSRPEPRILLSSGPDGFQGDIRRKSGNPATDRFNGIAGLVSTVTSPRPFPRIDHATIGTPRQFRPGPSATSGAMAGLRVHPARAAVSGTAQLHRRVARPLAHAGRRQPPLSDL